MPLRQLLIGLALISIAAGVATWGIRTYQQPAYEATVVMSGVRYGPADIGVRNGRDRQVVLINNLELSDLESTNEYSITSVRAINPSTGSLLSLVVTAPTGEQALNSANAVALELLANPLGAEVPRPLAIVVPATSAEPTTVPTQEAAAAVVVVGILGLAAIAITRPRLP